MGYFALFGNTLCMVRSSLNIYITACNGCPSLFPSPFPSLLPPPHACRPFTCCCRRGLSSTVLVVSPSLPLILPQSMFVLTPLSLPIQSLPLPPNPISLSLSLSLSLPPPPPPPPPPPLPYLSRQVEELPCDGNCLQLFLWCIIHGAVHHLLCCYWARRSVQNTTECEYVFSVSKECTMYHGTPPLL